MYYLSIVYSYYISTEHISRMITITETVIMYIVNNGFVYQY